jgi:hypothetical protein
MYRISGRKGNYYAAWINELDDDIDNIETFIAEGDGVLIVNEIEDVENFGINPESVEIV